MKKMWICFQIWNVRIWRDVLANSTTRIARFMKSQIWRKNVCIWLAAWTENMIQIVHVIKKQIR